MANTPTYEFFTPSPILAGVEAAVNAVNISRAEYEEAERAKQQYARFADVLESQGFEGDALAHRALAESIRPNFSRAIREKKTSDFGLSKLNENILNIFEQERRNQALLERQANQIDAVNRRAEFTAANQRANTLANSSLVAARQYEARAGAARQNAARARGEGNEALARQFDAQASQFEDEANRLRGKAMGVLNSAPRSISEVSDVVDDQLPQEDPTNTGAESALFDSQLGSELLLNTNQAPTDQPPSSATDVAPNPVLENAKNAALATRFAQNPRFVELVNGAQSPKEIDYIIRIFERDQSGILASNRDERAAERAQQLGQQSRSAGPVKFATFQEAQDEAARLAQYLAPNQDVKIGGAQGAWTVSVTTRKESEVIELADGSQLMFVGDKVMRRGPGSELWEETSMTPTAAWNALRITGQDRIPPTATQAGVAVQTDTAAQQPLTPQQKATNLKDSWLKEFNK